MSRYNAPYERDRPPRFRPYMGGGPRYGGPHNWRGSRPHPPYGGQYRDARPPFHGSYVDDRDIQERRMSYGDRPRGDGGRVSRFERQGSYDGFRRESHDSYMSESQPSSTRPEEVHKDKEGSGEPRRERRSRWDTDKGTASPALPAEAERGGDENTDAVPMEMSPEHDSENESGGGGEIVVSMSNDSDLSKSTSLEQTASTDDAPRRHSVQHRDSPTRMPDSSRYTDFQEADSSLQRLHRPHSAQNLYGSTSQGNESSHSHGYSHGPGSHMGSSSSKPHSSINSPALTPAHVPPQYSSAQSGHSHLSHTSSAPLSHGSNFSSTPHRGGKRVGSLSHQQSFPGGISHGSHYNSSVMRNSGPNTPTGMGNRSAMTFGASHQQGIIRQRIEANIANDKTILAHLTNWPSELLERKLHQYAEDLRKLRERDLRVELDLHKSYCALDLADLRAAICDKRREAIQQQLRDLEKPILT